MSNFGTEKQISQDYFSIDMPFFKRIILRNKSLVASFILFFAVLSWAYSLTKSPVYQGEFEIVLDMKNKNPSPAEIPQVFLSNLKENNNTLSTEVGILESPSVLRPIYEFVISEKKKINPKYREIDFYGWKENFLKVELKEETSILNIVYNDSEKKYIKPVLDKISEAYQIYSGKTKKRKIELAKNYLLSQISEYKLKSNKSFKRVQEYAIDNNLFLGSITGDSNIMGDFGGDLNFNDFTKNISTDEFFPNFGIEIARSTISNQIKKIDFQIKKINNLGNNYTDFQYVGAIAPGILTNSLMNDLTDIEGQLLELKTKYKPSDKNIKLFQKRKELTIELLKEKTIGLLEAKKLNLQSKLEAISRPKDIILNYKKLLREAFRDESTLVRLEDQLQVTYLEDAKLEDPWELITEPYVEDSPINNSASYIFLGIFGGLILGIILAMIKEKRNGFVLDAEVLEEKFNCKILDKFNVNNKEKLEVFNSQLKNILGSYKDETIKFLIIGEKTLPIVNFIKSININEKNFYLESKLSNILDAKKLFILSSLNSVEEKKLNYISSKINFMNIDIEGIIVLLDD